MADTPLPPSPSTPTQPTPPRRRRHRGRPGPWRVALLSLAAVLVALLAFAGVEVAVNRQPGEGLLPSLGSAILGSTPVNVLLIGNNARNATSPLSQGQADLLFVVHVDPARHQVVFISISRDVMVAYPGWDDPIPKIKSAFFMGGPQLAMQKVSQLTGLPISYYVVADFQGFAQAIDDVGGLWVNVKAPVYDPLHSGAVFKAGLQHMNGAQVLAYIRVRQNEAGNGYRVNDFQRMNAAFGIMDSLKHQILAHLSPGEVTNLLGLWMHDVATNLNEGQLAALAAEVLHAHLVHVTLGHLSDSMVLPSTALPGVNREGYIEGAYYDILTPQEILSQLAPYGSHNPTTGLPPLPPPSSVHAVVGGQDASLVSQLRAQGIQAALGNVPASSGVTQVLYPQGQLEAAEVVARAIGQSTEQLVPASVPVIEVEPGA
jgi:LCP family protein required for cell wall assembly